MSGPLRIREATPADEPALRALTEVEMPGTIRMAFRQVPDFFAAERVRGETRLGVLTDDSDAVLGCGARVARRAWFAGAWRRTGYYCTLRATADGRNARAVVTAYRWAREVERADPLAVVTSTVMSGNVRARRLLTSRRFALPAYLDAGEIMSFAVTAKALRRLKTECAGIEVVSATAVGEAALRAFYAEGTDHQPLFPALPDPLPPGLSLADFIVLRREGKIVAAAALWNQRPFRQVRITGYAPWLRMVRPLANLGLSLLGYPELPLSGDDLRFRYLAFRKIRGEGDLLRLLMSVAGSRLESGECLAFALHERDRLLAALKGLRAIRTASRLYTLSYDANPYPVDFGGVPYVEAAML